MNSKFREFVFCCKLFIFVIKNPQYKILHFHAIRGFELLLFPIFSFLGRKIILKVTLVGVDDPLTFKNRRFLSLLYMAGIRYVDYIVAISQELVERAIQSGISENKVKKIYNGFDEDSFFVPTPHLKKQLRRELKLNENATLFLSVGKVEYRKGYDLLIDAFKFIQLEMSESYLIIIGPDNNDENQFYIDLVAKINDLKLRNVVFLGAKDNVSEYFKAVDFFLFCSRQEGFGTVMIEAMACGVPSTVMYLKGVTEDIVTNINLGVIDMQRDAKNFAMLALQMVNDYDLARVKSSVEGLNKKFSITHIANQHLLIYEELLEH